MSVMLNVAFVGASILSLAFTGWLVLGSASPVVCVAIAVKTQLSGQVKVKDTSELKKEISKIIQKLLKCFNGTVISRFCLVFVCPWLLSSPSSWFASDIFPVILLLYLKDLEFVIGSAL